jgi:glycosyltransferase involved in cell wall biosynthesis
MTSPRISVIMPVYNAEPHLRAAIESVLGQTFGDFELLIFDDGSTDGSRAAIESYDDPRIRFFHHKENVGYVRHLNRGLELARGEYIFRMDADDIALPRRFERQLAFLDRHPEVGLCGAWVRYIGQGRGWKKPPATHEAIRVELLEGTAIVHPSAAMRRSTLLAHDLRYLESYLYTEDYEMWLKIARVARLANVPEILLLYRQHERNVSVLKAERQTELLNRLRVAQWEDFFQRPLDGLELAFATARVDYAAFSLDQYERLYRRMLEHNARTRQFDPSLFRRHLIRRLALPALAQKRRDPAFFLLFLRAFPLALPFLLRRFWERKARLPVARLFSSGAARFDHRP